MTKAQAWTVRVTALMAATWCALATAQIAQRPLQGQLRPTAPAPRVTPTLTLLPSVVVDGSLYVGSQLALTTRNAGAAANGRRVRMVRVSDGRAEYLNVVTWREGEVVVAIPTRPFGTDARMDAVLIGLSTSSGSWIGLPAQTAFAPNGAPRVGRRAAGCAQPDWDGDGNNAIECGGTDCDDGDSRRAPGRVEVCDAQNVDEDCDARTFGVRDTDGDGHADAACCNVDSGGGRICGDDCDDMRPSSHRTSTEVCDGIDNDCDGAVDEAVKHTLWVDRDGDGYGDPNNTQQACDWSPGLSYIGNDCNDADGRIYKGHGCD